MLAKHARVNPHELGWELPRTQVPRLGIAKDASTRKKGCFAKHASTQGPRKFAGLLGNCEFLPLRALQARNPLQVPCFAHVPRNPLVLNSHAIPQCKFVRIHPCVLCVACKATLACLAIPKGSKNLFPRKTKIAWCLLCTRPFAQCENRDVQRDACKASTVLGNCFAPSTQFPSTQFPSVKIHPIPRAILSFLRALRKKQPKFTLA